MKTFKENRSMVSPDVERDGLQCKCWAVVNKFNIETLGMGDMQSARWTIDKIKNNPERVLEIFRHKCPDECKRLEELGGLK